MFQEPHYGMFLAYAISPEKRKGAEKHTDIGKPPGHGRAGADNPATQSLASYFPNNKKNTESSCQSIPYHWTPAYAIISDETQITMPPAVTYTNGVQK